MNQYIILLFIIIINLFSQQLNQYSIRNLTVKNGLSQNSITTILQDSKGFMWFGSRAGLNRYNAYIFEEFKHVPFDSTSLIDSHINEIFEDSKGRFWIGTQSGLDLFNVSNRQFKHIILPSDTNTTGKPSINSIAEYRKKNIWLGSDSGLLLMDDHLIVRNYYTNQGDLDFAKRSEITDLLIQGDHLWIGTNNGLFRFNLINGEIETFQSEANNFYSISSNQINQIFQDQNGIIWIATDLGLNRYNQFEERFYGYFYNIDDPNSLTSDYITGLAEDSDRRIWTVSKNGLNIYDAANDEFEQFDFSQTKQLGNFVADFNAVFVDRLGTVWLGSVENGIIQLVPHEQSFRLYNSKLPPQLSSNQVSAVLLDQQSRLWVGTNYGLNRFNVERNKVEHFFEEPFNRSSISNDFINDVFQDNSGKVWFATRDGLNFFNEKTENFIRIDQKTSQVFTIENFVGNQFWIATNNGIGIVNFDSLNVIFPEQFKTIQAKRLLFDSKQRLWIGLENQLFSYNTNNETIQAYNHSSDDLNSISNEHVLSLHEDFNQQIWIGTRSGLNRYREKSNDFELIKEVAQLADDQIHWIESEKDGSLWISTNKGLTRILFGEQVSIKNFDSDDGLQNFAFFSAGYRSMNGELFFGGNNGLNSFFPNQINNRNYIVPNVIESIVTNNKLIYLDVDTLTEQIIELDHTDQVITFNFTSLDFISPDKNQYQYKLQGVDKDWVQSGKSHSVTYSNLLSGTYEFSFKGSNSSFNWNNNGASLKIKIYPPYWDSWWFRSIVAIIMFLLIASFLYSRFKRLNEIREIRGRIARDLHDDIGASLTEVTLMSELAQQLKDKQQLNSVLAKIEDVTRGLVSSLGDLVWSIDTKNETLDSLLLRMKDFATDLLYRQDIQITYKVMGIKSHQKIDHHLKQTVYLIFKEAINNIVKHSQATEVFVELKNDRKLFSLTITDNGKGLDLNAEQSGNGLNNMKIRAKRIGGTVNFSINNGLVIKLEAAALTL